MTNSELTRFLTRVIVDPAFRRELFTNQDRIILDYDFTPEEIEAIKGLDYFELDNACKEIYTNIQKNINYYKNSPLLIL